MIRTEFLWVASPGDWRRRIDERLLLDMLLRVLGVPANALADDGVNQSVACELFREENREEAQALCLRLEAAARGTAHESAYLRAAMHIGD